MASSLIYSFDVQIMKVFSGAHFTLAHACPPGDLDPLAGARVPQISLFSIVSIVIITQSASCTLS